MPRSGADAGAERAKYLYRIARIIQERAREVRRAGDHERRQADQGPATSTYLAAAHFFYHAGWADKLDYAFPGRRPAPWGWPPR